MIDNRYYIIDLTMENMFNLINKIVGNFQEQRISLDNTLVVIKLKDGDTNIYPELSKYKEYTYSEILKILSTQIWTDLSSENICIN